MPSPLNGLIEPAASPIDDPGRARLRVDRAGHRQAAAGGLAEHRVGVDAPVRRRGGRPLRHQVRGVDVAPVAEGRQQADADVDGPVAAREDPAVARAWRRRCGRARRGPTRSTGRRAAGSRSSRGWPCPAGAACRAGCRAPGRTGRATRRRRRRSGRGSRAPRRCALSLTTAPREQPVAQDRPQRLGALQQRGARAAAACSATIVSRSRRRTT